MRIKSLSYTAQEVLDKIRYEGGMETAFEYGIHELPVESDEVRFLLDIGAKAAQTLSMVYDRLEQVAYDEECQLVRQGK